MSTRDVGSMEMVLQYSHSRIHSNRFAYIFSNDILFEQAKSLVYYMYGTRSYTRAGRIIYSLRLFGFGLFVFLSE